MGHYYQQPKNPTSIASEAHNIRKYYPELLAVDKTVTLFNGFTGIIPIRVVKAWYTDDI